VFNKGTCQGFKITIPFGGQTHPISAVGFKLEWKKAQKTAKNNITSEAINKTIPAFNPLRTYDVCCPSNVPSRITSLHHKVLDAINIIIPNENKRKPSANKCI
jgi:hypothetical protein